MMMSSCNYKEIKNGGVGNQSGGTAMKATSLISASFVQTNVLSTCTDCHKPGQHNPTLASFSDIKTNMTAIRNKVLDNSMPKASGGYAPLTDCQKAILDRWVSLGAPENTEEQIGTLSACRSLVEEPVIIPIALAPLTYETLKTRILQKRCLTCHRADLKPNDPEIEAASFLFYPYSEIVGRPRIWAAPAEQSKIINMVTRRDSKQMPPDDSNVPVLTDDEVDFIKRWIDAGKPQ
jgi:uncharacterized membrane protein